jgi:hypothetical protein
MEGEIDLAALMVVLDECLGEANLRVTRAAQGDGTLEELACLLRDKEHMEAFSALALQLLGAQTGPASLAEQTSSAFSQLA